MLRRRVLTFGILLAVAFLLLVSLAVSALVSSLQTLVFTPSDTVELMWQVINFAVSFLIITALFALLFKLLPRVSVAWSDVIVGAGFTALLFNIGKLLIAGLFPCLLGARTLILTLRFSLWRKPSLLQPPPGVEAQAANRVRMLINVAPRLFLFVLRASIFVIRHTLRSMAGWVGKKTAESLAQLDVRPEWKQSR